MARLYTLHRSSELARSIGRASWRACGALKKWRASIIIRWRDCGGDGAGSCRHRTTRLQHATISRMGWSERNLHFLSPAYTTDQPNLPPTRLVVQPAARYVAHFHLCSSDIRIRYSVLFDIPLHSIFFIFNIQFIRHYIYIRHSIKYVRHLVLIDMRFYSIFDCIRFLVIFDIC